jgi:hypothetical protein
VKAMGYMECKFIMTGGWSRIVFLYHLGLLGGVRQMLIRTEPDGDGPDEALGPSRKQGRNVISRRHSQDSSRSQFHFL